MSRRQKEPLRALSDEERMTLSRLSQLRQCPRSAGGACDRPLAVAEGQSYTAAAKQVGRRNGDTVPLGGALQSRRARRGRPRHGAGAGLLCREQQRRILADGSGTPDRARTARPPGP